MLFHVLGYRMEMFLCGRSDLILEGTPDGNCAAKKSKAGPKSLRGRHMGFWGREMTLSSKSLHLNKFLIGY